MKISKEEVRHVARLARLELDAGELDKFTAQLDAILVFMDKIRVLDVSGVEPTYHALDNLSNVLRQDEPMPTLSRDKVLQNAPQQENGFFRVPRIVEEQE